jgi:hypothetical protein
MAPPRKKKRAPGEGHPVHLRLPTDVFQWVEKQAEKKGWPFNRVIINTLADFPDLERYRDFAYHLSDMKTVLAHYGSRITLAEFTEPMLQAIDAVLAAKTDGERQSRLDRLRVLRTAMIKTEKAAKE